MKLACTIRHHQAYGMQGSNASSTVCETHQTKLESCQISRQWRPLRGWHNPTTRIRFRDTDRPGCKVGRIPNRPSCASLPITTTSRRIARTLPSRLLPIRPIAFSFSFPSSVVCKHRRSFVLKLLVKELSISSIIIRWRYPFPWYYAWEGDAYARGAI
jgi:hypothetical protein